MFTRFQCYYSLFRVFLFVPEYVLKNDVTGEKSQPTDCDKYVKVCYEYLQML